MTKTTVVNVRHRVPFDFYVGRKMPAQEKLTGPTRGQFGNPFGRKWSVPAGFKGYVDWFLSQVEPTGRHFNADFAKEVLAMRGARLACWCHPPGNRNCHALVIAAWLDGDAAELEELRKVFDKP